MSAAASAAAIPAGASVGCPEYGAGTSSLLGVLRFQLEHMPGRVVCHRVVRQRSGFVSTPLSVAELVVRARRAAAAFVGLGVREGDRVVLSLSDPHDFLAGFFGALLAGASAVPLPTLAESGAPRSFAARVRGVCKDCGPSIAVAENAAQFEHPLGKLPAGLRVVEPTALQSATEDAASLDDRAASATAFIQYTSGSTGAPKGVVVTHGNIIANCRAIRDATAYTRADRMVSWLPLHHDMGLVGGLLTSIYCAAETCLMPPMSFVARPVSWLEAITHFEAKLTVAPTFAYSLCARKIPARQLEGIDLSSLRLAYVGAEPVDPATVDAFVERFSAYGLSPQAIYPVYGLAEATLAVAFPQPGSGIRRDSVDRVRLATEGVAAPLEPGSPQAVTFISVGRPLPGHKVEIVCPETGLPLGDRRVGELVVEGPSVTPRYFGEGGAARQHLRTGDLAYAAGGHLYIVDRIKDLVIVAGRSYAPSDIENAIAGITGLRRGRIVAFSAPGDAGTEELHVVAEASADSWRLPESLIEEVQRRLRREIGLSASTVTVVRPGTLERTSSGKVRRRACAEAHRNGTLAAVRTRLDVLAFQLARRRDRLLYAGRRALHSLRGRNG